MRSERLAPLSGIVFVVLLVLGFGVFGGDTPDIDDSGSKILDYYNDHQGGQIAAAILVALSTLFLAVFIVSLRDYLRSTGTGGEFWSTIALVGGAVSVAGFLVAVGVHVALIDGGDKNLSPDAMVALNAIDSDDFFAFALPLGIMMLGATGAILKAGAALPRWLGWAALVLFIVQFTPAGFIAFGLTGIWIIVASILMYQHAARPTATAPAVPAT
jgi:hypothetical protein